MSSANIFNWFIWFISLYLVHLKFKCILSKSKCDIIKIILILLLLKFGINIKMVTEWVSVYLKLNILHIIKWIKWFCFGLRRIVCKYLMWFRLSVKFMLQENYAILFFLKKCIRYLQEHSWYKHLYCRNPVLSTKSSYYYCR